MWVRTRVSGVRSEDEDGESSYALEVRYAYSYAGQDYVGDRYNGISSRLGDYETKLQARLSQTREVQVWVNPDEPSESILDRELRWDVIRLNLSIAALFSGLAGAALIRLVLQQFSDADRGAVWRRIARFVLGVAAAFLVAAGLVAAF